MNRETKTDERRIQRRGGMDEWRKADISDGPRLVMSTTV